MKFRLGLIALFSVISVFAVNAQQSSILVLAPSNSKIEVIGNVKKPVVAKQPVAEKMQGTIAVVENSDPKKIQNKSMMEKMPKMKKPQIATAPQKRNPVATPLRLGNADLPAAGKDGERMNTTVNR